MHAVNSKVLSALKPQAGAVAGGAATAGMAASVQNEIRKAEASTTTSIVHIKDKKVRCLAGYGCAGMQR
jgi:hypothetical protein